MTKSKIGSKIQEYRKLKGLSRAQLADKAGLTDVAIWKIETGQCLPRTQSAESIAEALGIPTSLLFT